MALSEEQQTKVREFAAQWRADTSSCEPADRERAEEAVSALYANYGRPTPRFAWVDSPAAAIEAAIEQKVHRRSSLWSDLRSEGLTCNVTGPEGRQILDAYFKFFQEVVFDSLTLPRDRVGLNFGYRYGRGRSSWYGSDVSLPQLAGYLLCLRDVLDGKIQKYNSKDGCHVDGSELLDLHVEIARSLWYYWPYKEVCFMCERPKVARLKDGVLHSNSASEPALVFRDGFSVAVVNGKVLGQQAGDGAAA